MDAFREVCRVEQLAVIVSGEAAAGGGDAQLVFEIKRHDDGRAFFGVWLRSKRAAAPEALQRALANKVVAAA